ncbi:hypothetical protein TNCV_4282201 [Trichonephila clavipes]|nr:hypothetical protein TNCV_4282201 [Trichonephila clavipes]
MNPVCPALEPPLVPCTLNDGIGSHWLPLGQRFSPTENFKPWVAERPPLLFMQWGIDLKRHGMTCPYLSSVRFDALSDKAYRIKTLLSARGGSCVYEFRTLYNP